MRQQTGQYHIFTVDFHFKISEATKCDKSDKTMR